MLIYFIAIIALSLCKAVTIDVMPKLKKNVLNFGYGANFNYEEMLTHSFDRFYIVAKYEIPKVEHLHFPTFTFDLTCNHLNISKSPLLGYVKHCRRIAPYVKFYNLVEAWYSLEQYIGLKEDKLSSTTVDFIRSEGNLVPFRPDEVHSSG